MYREKKYRLLFAIFTFACSVAWGCSSMDRQIQLPSNTATTVSSFRLTPTSPPVTATFPPLWLTPVTIVPPSPPSDIPPTWTPLPTYSPKEAATEMSKLYNNSECDLPCWWGIIPGETNWNEAWQSLGRFSENEKWWELALTESEFMPGYIPFTPHLKDLDGNLVMPDDLAFMIKTDTFTVEYISLRELSSQYTISDIFLKYGEPENIYIHGGNTQAGYRYVLFLYYPLHGFISAYVSNIVAVEGQPDNPMKMCFQKNATLLTWAQNKFMTINDLAKLSLMPELDEFALRYLRSLDTASTTTVSTFFKMLTTSGKQPQPCIMIFQ
jgi:hypothetical protein